MKLKQPPPPPPSPFPAPFLNYQFDEAYDEMFDSPGVPRSHYQALFRERDALMQERQVGGLLALP